RKLRGDGFAKNDHIGRFGKVTDPPKIRKPCHKEVSIVGILEDKAGIHIQKGRDEKWAQLTLAHAFCVPKKSLHHTHLNKQPVASGLPHPEPRRAESRRSLSR